MWLRVRGLKGCLETSILFLSVSVAIIEDWGMRSTMKQSAQKCCVKNP